MSRSPGASQEEFRGLEKTNEKQLKMIDSLQMELAAFRSAQSTQEAEGNQTHLSLKRQLADTTAELTRVSAELRGEKKAALLASDQLDESRRKLGEKERQTRDLDSKLKQSKAAEQTAQARSAALQQNQIRAESSKPPTTPSPRQSQTPGRGPRGSDPALQDLVAWQVTFSQVASQLRSSTEMPVGPETDAYVAMLCKKAEKMNEKLMAEGSPASSAGNSPIGA